MLASINDRRWSRLLLALLIAGLLVPAGAPARAQSDPITFIVTTTADAPDADIADGVCSSTKAPAAPRCSLRAAIMQANALAGHQEIVLEPTVYRLTIPGANENLGETGDLDISDDVTITLPALPPTKVDVRATIDASGLGDRVLHVLNPLIDGTVNLALSSVQVVGGDLSAANPEGAQEASDIGGGILLSPRTSASVLQVLIARNKARIGGGIFVAGDASLTVRFSQVSDNEAVGRDGEQAGNLGGGGIFVSSSPSAGSLNIRDTTINRNRARLSGGGIFNRGELNAFNVLISDNTAGGDGGGIHNETKFASLELKTSTLARNRAETDGGAIRWDAGPATLDNVTISANRAAFGGGLARRLLSAEAAELSRFRHITVAGNIASIGGGIATNLSASDAKISSFNSIIANNTLANCSHKLLGDLDSRANLVSDASCGNHLFATFNNLNPQLGPLQFNGGPTPTHAIPASSPAVYLGLNAAQFCLSTDQRGVARPVGNTNPDAPNPSCDLGAFELAPNSVGTFALVPAASSLTVEQTTTLTLRWTHPERWRDLNMVDVQLRYGEQLPLWVRFTEGVTETQGISLTNGLTLYNSHGTPAGVGEPGQALVLESDSAAIDLAQSRVQGSGPQGKDVTLTLAVRLKQPAAGKVYAVTLLAGDDDGRLQGPNEAGTLAAGPFTTFLPLAVR